MHFSFAVPAVMCWNLWASGACGLQGGAVGTWKNIGGHTKEVFGVLGMCPWGCGVLAPSLFSLCFSALR